MVASIESYTTTYETQVCVPPDADSDGDIGDDFTIAADYNPAQFDQVDVIVDQYDPFVIRRANPISEVDDEEDDEMIIFTPKESVSLCWENSFCRQEDDAAELAFDQNVHREYCEEMLHPQTPESRIGPFECSRDDIFIHNDRCCSADDTTHNSSVEYGARVSPTERNPDGSTVSKSILKCFLSYFLAVLTMNQMSFFSSKTDDLTSPGRQSKRKFLLYSSLTKGLLFIVLGCIAVFGTSVLSSNRLS